MKHIQESNKAIDNAGGDHELARKLAVKTGIEQHKLYGRIRMWRINGVSIKFVRSVAKFGRIAITRLIP
jgi:hypothetical protein